MRVSAAVLLVLLAALPAASVDNFAAPPATSEAPASPVAVEDLDLVKLKVEELTLREKVSQLMFVTFQGLYGPNNEDRALMAQYTPGGVLISATVKPGLAADYVKALRALNAERKFGIPLFIAADVYRLTQHGDGTLSTFLQLPSPMAVAAAGDEESTRRLGSLIAESLELMGFNMNMGPRLELAPDVEGVRGTVYTFGSDPAFAAKAGA
ncbi:MAG: hypothetical protein GWP08_14525, partial [Nitrospiraceae bacterium]|nr:hypothetical protein [Nitrospiraceae bacterium]